eukprot:s1249_g3.t1
MKVMIPGPTDTEKLRRAVAECGARVMRGSQVNKTNVIIQQDPTRPKTSASFAAFLFGMLPERARRFRTVAFLATAFVSEREQRDDQEPWCIG